jgi:hypothetical protein
VDEGQQYRKSVEDQEYRASLEELVTARTEQLRDAYSRIEGLVQALSEILSVKSLERAKETAQAAVQKLGPKEPERSKFGGEPGGLVPEVDPDDVKSAWKIQADAEAKNPGKLAATGGGLLKRACKPGANIEAIGYRAAVLLMIRHIAPEQWARLAEKNEPTESAFRAAAKVRLEWMAPGVARQSPPFDAGEFFQLCGLT